jgi:ABC-type cobalamin/Fe3+-siderophores transport system ATPase subunit/SAM-dependent methyltransferase
VRITSFIPLGSQVEALGLSQVAFHNLKQLVVLAGPNGSGKSRVLQLLTQTATYDQSRISSRDNLQRQKREIGEALRIHDAGQVQPEERVVAWRSQFKQMDEGLQRLACITLDEETEKISVLNFVPRRVDLLDSRTITPIDLRNRAERAIAPGVDVLWETALPYIQRLQNRMWEVTHPSYEGTPEDHQNAVDSYARLKGLIEGLLATRLSRSLDGEAIVFDKPIAASNLSEGQRILLQLAVAVHPAHDEKGIVLTMDEPENHLHPAALISILDRVRLALPNTQIWIATHSVPLMAHLYDKQPDCLYFVEGGAVTFAGTKPQLVLRGLLGDDREQSKLLRFIDLPHSLAALQFAAACLIQPTVADHQYNDSQLVQVRNLLNASRAQNSKLKILDFGAGKARLLGGLAENSENVSSEFDYVAYDADPTYNEERERQLLDVYRSAGGRCFADIDQLFAGHAEGSFDAVVMCNVLHEIDPDDWLAVLGESGPVHRALGAHGNLLLVEDFRIPVGELPNPRGFFLLNTIHLQKLFNITRQSELGLIHAHDARGDGRLIAHVIPRQILPRLTSESRKAAIQALRETCARQLEERRQQSDTSYKAGLLNALWSQQYVNCALYLQTM